MSHPHSIVVDNQESGSGSHTAGVGAGGSGSVAGNGIGNGVGAGVRSWWRNSRGERRRESMVSNESAPKSPSQGNEMVIVSSNFAGLSPIITSGLYNAPNINPGSHNAPPVVSPISPRTGSNPVMFTHQPQEPLQDSQPLERPQAAAMRNEAVGAGNLVMQEVGQAVQRPVDIEAQQLPLPSEMGKWWWQRGSLRGLQSKLITVLVAGGFLAITLAIYLGLALTNDLRLRHEWHVLLILIILIATMFFCHALVRLCILATNPSRFQRSSRNFSRIPSISGPDGYANPREPIRIQTHFEHDVDGVEPDLTKLPPPVYGLWRCSVRVNPNQFYWVRRASVQPSAIPEGTEPTSPRSRNTPRPPSYLSEDGVSYALAAENSLPPPRPEPPLPPHPSEVRWLQGH